VFDGEQKDQRLSVQRFLGSDPEAVSTATVRLMRESDVLLDVGGDDTWTLTVFS
jgi:hypothetical protein